MDPKRETHTIPYDKEVLRQIIPEKQRRSTEIVPEIRDRNKTFSSK